MTIKTILISKLQPGFSFAGFTWPRYVARLPAGPLADRLARRRPVVCGQYYHAPAPVTAETGHFSGYLGSDFWGYRWQWADEIAGANIDHRGWFSDEYGDSDKIRGIVILLPHGRYLAGWSMGEGMASTGRRRFFDDPIECAYYADQMAEQAAEQAREEEQARAEEEEEEENAPAKMDLLCDSHHGVYIPQIMGERMAAAGWQGLEPDDLQTLAAGPDHEWYWDSWDRILNNAEWRDPDTGETWRLLQDGDLWAYTGELPDGFDF